MRGAQRTLVAAAQLCRPTSRSAVLRRAPWLSIARRYNQTSTQDTFACRNKGESPAEFVERCHPRKTEENWVVAARGGGTWEPAEAPSELRERVVEVMDSRGAEVNMQDLEPLFVEHGLTAGKWLASVWPTEIDNVWPKLLEALDAGALGEAVQLSSGSAAGKPHMLGVHTADLTDKDDLHRVLRGLHEAGLRKGLNYKALASTALGIYASKPGKKVPEGKLAWPDGSPVTLYRADLRVDSPEDIRIVSQGDAPDRTKDTALLWNSRLEKRKGKTFDWEDFELLRVVIAEEDSAEAAAA
eukprot:TRINITY_DN47058_c0_g1_i1.p1 TRINITY_DN47058_c0_g1~~TRINITY_DN47058_c0_g1_i1.p1  ORF type:complete len:318 (+),score=67.93 TRINITY_DN47058_c0_g1_i1:58-954(+)